MTNIGGDITYRVPNFFVGDMPPLSPPVSASMTMHIQRLFYFVSGSSPWQRYDAKVVISRQVRVRTIVSVQCEDKRTMHLGDRRRRQGRFADRSVSGRSGHTPAP